MSNCRDVGFSIVVPCYNSERTVGETLASALSQTRGDLEVIAVNDGSTDGSASVLADFAARDRRVRIVTQANGGLSAARNSGMRAARGHVLVFLDADDRLMPDFLDCHAANLATDPRIGLSYGRARFMDWEGRPLTQQTRVLGRDVQPRDALMNNPVTACFAARRELVEEVGPFDTTLRRVEDADWVFRASLTGWRIAGIDRVLYDYRTSPGGLSSDLGGMLEAYDRFLDLARERAPSLVAEVGSESRARMLLYLERRAIAFGKPRAEVGRLAWAAFKTCPSLILKDPVRVTGMLMAGLVPGVAGLVAPRVRHA